MSKRRSREAPASKPSMTRLPPTTQESQDEALARRLEILFEKNVTAINELREVVSEAHGILRDLRLEIKKAEQIGPAIVTKRMRAEVVRAVKELEIDIDKAIGLTTASIYKRFDTLMAILMGEDEPDKPSVTAMVESIGPLAGVLREVINGKARVEEDPDKSGIFAIIRDKQRVV